MCCMKKLGVWQSACVECCLTHSDLVQVFQQVLRFCKSAQKTDGWIEGFAGFLSVWCYSHPKRPLWADVLLLRVRRDKRLFSE